MPSEKEDREHLVDYFAGQILNGIFANITAFNDCGTNKDKAVAIYDVAEAMVREKETRL